NHYCVFNDYFNHVGFIVLWLSEYTVIVVYFYPLSVGILNINLFNTVRSFLRTPVSARKVTAFNSHLIQFFYKGIHGAHTKANMVVFILWRFFSLSRNEV